MTAIESAQFKHATFQDRIEMMAAESARRINQSIGQIHRFQMDRLHADIARIVGRCPCCGRSSS